MHTLKDFPLGICLSLKLQIIELVNLIDTKKGEIISSFLMNRD